MFSTRLRELRTARGISQAKLAEGVGVSKSTIAMYESGKREPNFLMLETLADFFNVDTTYFFEQSQVDAMYAAYRRSSDPDDEEFITLAHKIKRLSPEDRKRVDDVLKLMFPEDFA